MAAPTDVQVTSSGTTTIHTLPASNAAGVTDDHALPIQGVTGGVPVPVSAASLPLPVGAAQDGTDGTGITPPTGATGIRGWLSGIFNKLNTSIAVTGTFWQSTQPISATSLPLPAGAAAAAKQPALGTAGTPSADVITVQGNPSGTPQPISGTITANLGTLNGAALDASVNGLLVSQSSATSGQKGTLHLGAVTSAAPSYTTAQSSPLSLDTSGNLRVNLQTAIPAGSSIIGKTGIDQTTPGSTNGVTDVGSSNWGVSRASVANTATQLIASRAGRQAIVVVNLGTTPVYLGGSGVTTSNGTLLPGVAGATRSIPFSGAIYGVVTSGSQSVSVEEFY